MRHTTDERLLWLTASVILVAVQLQHSKSGPCLIPHNDCLFAGAYAEDKAAPRRPALRPIAIRLGSGGSLQPGEGFVTPGHPGALAQGSYKTSPSGEWAVFSSAASSDCAYQVPPVSSKKLVES